ncbi:MAG: NAD(P)-dependent oxidoreductase [Rhodospirillaceae bacterium]
MAMIIVEDDKILRFVQCLLDDKVVPERLAAFRDFLAFDVPDVDGWIASVRKDCAAIYPADVRTAADQDELRGLLPEADGAVIEALEIGADELAIAPKLRIVQNFGLDRRNIDLDACAAKGVATPVFNRRVNRAVGEHAIALMMAVGRKIVATDRALDFAALEDLGYAPKLYDVKHISGANWARVTGLKNLFNSTLGALGLGEVGREVAIRAKAMGMKILYYQRRQLPPEVEAEWGAEYVSFDELMRRSDFISVNLPLNDGTRGMIDAKAFELMKPGAILVNVSRAHIVERDALIAALASGKLGGAAFDVHYEEPSAVDEPLKAFPNVVLSPHIAVGPRTEALTDMAEIVGNLARAIGGN